MMPFYALDELDRVLGGAAVRPPHQTDRGGESDPFRTYSRRTIRRLTGGGYFRRDGHTHDDLIDIITANVPEVHTPDQAIDWYVTSALAAMREHRVIRNRRVYARRNRRAIAAGFRSFWHMRTTNTTSERRAA